MKFRRIFCFVKNAIKFKVQFQSIIFDTIVPSKLVCAFISSEKYFTSLFTSYFIIRIPNTSIRLFYSDFLVPLENLLKLQYFQISKKISTFINETPELKNFLPSFHNSCIEVSAIDLVIDNFQFV